MAPFGGEPGVVEIEPADHATDIERCRHRVELKGRAGHFGAVRHHRSRNNRPHELGACGVRQRLEAATERVHQAQPRGVVRFGALDFILERVVGDIDQDLVGFGADVGNLR